MPVGFVDVPVGDRVSRVEIDRYSRFACPEDPDIAVVADAMTDDLAPTPAVPGDPLARLQAFAAKMGLVATVADGNPPPSDDPPGTIY